MTLRITALLLLLCARAACDTIRIDHREGSTGNYAPVTLVTVPNYVITFDINGAPIMAAQSGVSLSANNTWTGTNTFANVTAAASSIWNLSAATVSLGTLATLPVTSIELGHATANTLTAASGVLSIEGAPLLTATAIDTLAELDAATQLPVEFCVAMSDETTTITTGTAKVTMRSPYAFTLTGVRASVNTVSSSGLPTVDINEGAGAGTTVLSTKLTIDASEFTSVTAAAAAVISDTAIADDAQLTFDIDVSGTGAKGLKVWIYGYR